jgi:hypothetical protein
LETSSSLGLKCNYAPVVFLYLAFSSFSEAPLYSESGGGPHLLPPWAAVSRNRFLLLQRVFWLFAFSLMPLRMDEALASAAAANAAAKPVEALLAAASGLK